MSNIIPTNRELFPASADGWATVPATGSGSIRGKLVKFTNGEFFVGEELINGRELVAVGVLVAWVKWAGGRPAEIRETAPAHAHPHREALGDMDVTRWEKGLDGKPSDPWRDSRNLFLIDLRTGAEFTFTTASWGGRAAIEDLSRQIANVRSAYPSAAPVVKLSVEKMKTRFGLKPKPVFEIVSWKSADNPAQKKAPTKSLAAERGDEFPF
jgi:hypothetical protein